MQSLKGYRAKVRSLSFSPDGACLASCGGKGENVSLWALPKGKRTYLKGHRQALARVRFGPDGRLLSCDQFVSSRVWERDLAGPWTSRTIREYLADFVGGTGLVCLQHEFRSSTYSLRYTDGRSDAPTRPDVTFPVSRGVALFAGSPTGPSVALPCFDYLNGNARNGRGTVRLVRPDQAEPVVERLIAAIPYAVCFSPDGATVAVGTTKSLQRFDVATGDELPALKGHTRMVTGLAYLPDGRLLSCSTDGTARTWDHDSAKCLTSHDWQLGELTAVAVAADGMRAAAGSDNGEILIWDLD